MMLIILNILCGALLGMRFKVFILFPAILVSVGLNADIAAAHGSGLWPTLLAIALSLTGLQLGFLGGLVTRHAMAASRAPRSHALTGRPPLHPPLPADDFFVSAIIQDPQQSN
jgi:hypothetical protein